MEKPLATAGAGSSRHKDDLWLRAAVLAKLAPGLKPEGKSEAYLAARFDAAIEAIDLRPERDVGLLEFRQASIAHVLLGFDFCDVVPQFILRFLNRLPQF